MLSVAVFVIKDRFVLKELFAKKGKKEEKEKRRKKRKKPTCA